MKKLCCILVLVSTTHINGMLRRVAVLTSAARPISSSAYMDGNNPMRRYEVGVEDAKDNVLNDLPDDVRRMVQEAAIGFWAGNQGAPFNAKSEALRIIACNEKRVAAHYAYQERRCASRQNCEGLDKDEKYTFSVIPELLWCDCALGSREFQVEVKKEVDRLIHLLSTPGQENRVYKFLEKMRNTTMNVSLKNENRVQE